MSSIKTWRSTSDSDMITCPECNAVMAKPRDSKQLSCNCTRCGVRLYNETQLFHQTHSYIETLQNSDNILYDENLEAIMHFLEQFAFQSNVLEILMPFFRELSDKTLGKDWYIADSVDGLSGLQIEADTIMRTLFKKTKKWFGGKK